VTDTKNPQSGLIVRGVWHSGGVTAVPVVTWKTEEEGRWLAREDAEKTTSKAGACSPNIWARSSNTRPFFHTSSMSGLSRNAGVVGADGWGPTGAGSLKGGQ